MTTIGVFLLTASVFCEHPQLQSVLGVFGLLSTALGIGLIIGST